MAALKRVLFSIFIPLILKNAEGFRVGRECNTTAARHFHCLSEPTRCVAQAYICDGLTPDCPGGEDEEDCRRGESCWSRWKYFTCRSSGACINISLVCDGYNNCGDYSDEMCEGYEGFNRLYTDVPMIPTTVPITTTERPSVMDMSQWNATRNRLLSWFVGRRQSDKGLLQRWGSDVARIVVALFLADERFFSFGNTTGEEIQYELVNRLLLFLDKNPFPKNGQELALYINALRVSCLNPRNFYGKDLIRKLREIVDGRHSFIPPSKDPFSILVLCNAGDTMTARDVQKVIQIYNSTSRPYWTDVQALSVLALACLSTRTSVDARLLHSMGEELKQKQFLNGTVQNIHTTALVVQALTATNNLGGSFDHYKALQSLAASQRSDGSIGTLLDSYYAIAAFSGTSLLNVTNNHCHPTYKDVQVVNSVWLGEDAVLGRTWRFMHPPNATCYDILEKVNKIDSCNGYGIKYNVVEGKPFVSSVLGIEDDPEKGLFWFTYIKKDNEYGKGEKFTQSPADVILREKEELVLWYRNIRRMDNATAASDGRAKL